MTVNFAETVKGSAGLFNPVSPPNIFDTAQKIREVNRMSKEKDLFSDLLKSFESQTYTSGIITKFGKYTELNDPKDKKKIESTLSDCLSSTVDVFSGVNILSGIMNHIVSNNLSMSSYKGIPVNNLNNIYIIGAGGIGSWLMPKLVKLINDSHRKNLTKIKNLVICDGDHVEDSNLVRQNFCSLDVGENKAKVLFDRYGDELVEDVAFIYIDKYLTDTAHLSKVSKDLKDKFIDFSLVMSEMNANEAISTNIIINLIDNAASRKRIHNLAKGTGNTIIIDVANNTYNGQLSVSNYTNMRSRRNHRSGVLLGYSNTNFYSMFPENTLENDDISIFDCGNQDVNAVEQLFDVNQLGAGVLASFMNTIFEKKKLTHALIEYKTGSGVEVTPKYPLVNVYHRVGNNTRATTGQELMSFFSLGDSNDTITDDVTGVFDKYAKLIKNLCHLDQNASLSRNITLEEYVINTQAPERLSVVFNKDNAELLSTINNDILGYRSSKNKEAKDFINYVLN